jgi:transcriptional regulator with XRE-family HTH domain
MLQSGPAGGIANQLVSGWERGYVSPSRGNIFELSRIFGVPRERILIEGDETIPPHPTQQPPARLALSS